MEVDGLFEEAIAAMRHDRAEIVDPVAIATIGEYRKAELQVMMFEFKEGLNQYLTWLGRIRK